MSPLHRTLRFPLSAAIALLLLGDVHAQDVRTLKTASGSFTAQLTIPKSANRPPIVVIASPGGASLIQALSAEGIASLHVTGSPDAATMAQWIAQIRNEPNFPTTTVYGDGALVTDAIIAARAARADGVAYRDGNPEAIAEAGRLVAAKSVIAEGSPTEIARRIAEFARSVPVLGRRGTTAARPTTGRRSLRQVALLTLGAARIGIEWGSPQKRDREIWGGIVRWNENWMPGADEATTLTTNVPIRIGTLMVPAGDHTFYTVPGTDHFQLVISNDVGQFHTVHDVSRELGRTEMAAGTRPDSVEGLTFTIEARDTGAVLKLIWDTREFSVPVVILPTIDPLR